MEKSGKGVVYLVEHFFCTGEVEGESIVEKSRVYISSEVSLDSNLGLNQTLDYISCVILDK